MLNPIDLRDLIIDEPDRTVRDDTIRALLARGWPGQAILAELPGVSEADIRRVAEAEQRAA